jgi:hypothetical protein
MDQRSTHNVPDDERIEKLLSQFKPQPKQRFFNKMSTAPWISQSSSEAPLTSKHLMLRRLPVLGIIGCSLLVIILVFAFVPSARVTAEQIIHFFLPSSTNQLEVQLTPINPTLEIDFSNPANFTLDIAEAAHQAGMEIKEISPLTSTLKLIGARYESSYHAVILLYTGNGYKLFLTQRILDKGQDIFSIGADAKIEMVKIGDIQGEYVEGGWEAVSTQSAIENLQDNVTIKINATWDNEYPQSTLRWQANDKVYELRASGENIPSQSQLIDWANGLK